MIVSVWSPERVERLVALAAEAFSSREIAAMLNSEFGINVTRTACIGKLNRLGLRVLGRDITTTEPAKVAPAAVRIALGQYAPTGEHPVTILQVREFECRVILPGQDEVSGPERLMCGNPTSTKSRFRFCEACAAVMFGAGTYQERSTVPARLAA